MVDRVCNRSSNIPFDRKSELLTIVCERARPYTQVQVSARKIYAYTALTHQSLDSPVLQT